MGGGAEWAVRLARWFQGWRVILAVAERLGMEKGGADTAPTMDSLVYKLAALKVICYTCQANKSIIIRCCVKFVKKEQDACAAKADFCEVCRG